MLRTAARARRALAQAVVTFQRSGTHAVERSVLPVASCEVQAFPFHADPCLRARWFAKQPPNSEIPMDHEHVNIGNEIDKELLRAHDTGQVNQLFFVMEHHGEEFNQINVCTAFKHLGDLVEKDSSLKDEVQSNDKFQTLIDMVVMGRRKYDIAQLTGVVDSLGKLHYENDVILDRLSQHIMDKLPQAGARDLVQLATTLAHLDHSPSVVLFDSVQKKAVEVKGDFKKGDKKALEEAFQKFGYKHDELSSALKG